MTIEIETETSPKPKRSFAWLLDLLLIPILAAAAFLRFSGSDWGDLQHQHPDESFFVSVAYDISPLGSTADEIGAAPNSVNQPWRLAYPEAYHDCTEWGGYFDTACSPLNPHNRGHSFYVYGDLPVMLVRGTMDLINRTIATLSTKQLFGRDLSEVLHPIIDVKLLGRQISAIFDLGTITLLYFIVKRIYKRCVALLAATFSALAVMQIQQSHFYTTDNFTVFFMFLAIFFAVELAFGAKPRLLPDQQDEPEFSNPWSRFVYRALRFIKQRDFVFSLLFGMAFGMAVASKLNAVPMAVVLPLAFFVRDWRSRKDREAGQPAPNWSRIAGYVIVGAVASILSFRVFQPYAFYGFFSLNPLWLANIAEVRAMATPNANPVWNLQWANRTHLYSFQNLTIWGLGLPLGILAWAGFLWMAWRSLRGEWRQHLLLWSWTAAYFGWQSLQFNPTMRYQLPVYPLLAMMAAWLVVWLWDKGKRTAEQERPPKVFRLLSVFLGGVVLLLTAAWAYAFMGIYTRTEARIAASEWIFQNIPGPINLQIQTADDGVYQQPLPFYSGGIIQLEQPYGQVFGANATGTLTGILLPHVADSSLSGVQTLTVNLSTSPDPLPEQVLASASVTADFAVRSDKRGEAFTLTFASPVVIERGIIYYLQLKTTGGTLSLTGDAFANETDYDYTLPFNVSGYDAFGGIYRGDLNLQVYWDDNADKLARFLYTLNETDYIIIPTNHQYAQITRLPQRYPLTTEYYRQLIGCPEGEDIITCYRTAEPGTYQGNLGFELVATFESYPTLGPIRINDQAAEEAFTFYDHPKVLIFHKTEDYDPASVAAILGAVDYSTAINLTPGQLDAYKSLMLTATDWKVQQEGGTWSELFDYDAIQNKYPGLGVVLWYLVIFVVGLLAYPLTRVAFPGLPDRGYPLARIVGLLLWAWLSWMAGSLGLTYTKPIIAVALGVVALIGGWQAWRQREELKEEFREKWKYFLLIEIIFLAFFLLDLGSRLGNPDLWHPSKGGERPMDFAYFNAVLKSTTFPPYDPWYAGGYINYYYYGYVIVGTPVKLLGIVPSIAFNFILPTLYAMLALAAFSVIWNLIEHNRHQTGEPRSWLSEHRLPLFGGLSGSASLLLLGNLGIVRLFALGFQRIAAPGGVIEGANLFEKIWWTLKGFGLALVGQNLPYANGDWYWFCTRIFPVENGIDFYEFPLFTFLYSDLHAHMIAYMITVLVLAWALSVLLSRAQWKSKTDLAVSLLVGGLIIGSLKPTNTWDFYTYFVLALVVVFYAVIRYATVDHFLPNLPAGLKRMALAFGAAGLLAGLSILMYQPFSQWFGQAYDSIQKWTGARTPVSIFLTQWGVFLFFIISWLAWETRQWMASTPVSALRKLRPYRELILMAVVLVLFFLVGQQIWVMSSSQNIPWPHVTSLWISVPVAIWAAVLLFRPGISDGKRLVLFMIGTGLFLTMVVELLVIEGDIGRMNTIYKFGVQTWVLLGISAAAAFAWLLSEIHEWHPQWRTVWSVFATLLASGAFLFLLIAGADKIRDRMALTTPHSFDSMEYMNYARYGQYGVDMDLSEDYRAIRWMQENIQGSPVIVEAAPAGSQYTWLGRISIYTGLPSVVGWEWHEIQQRVLFTAQVMSRGIETDQFYATTDMTLTLDFLEKYDVEYIIIGQLERAKYAPGAPGGKILADEPDGLLKFEQYNGLYWTEVYRDGQTVIYQVNP